MQLSKLLGDLCVATLLLALLCIFSRLENKNIPKYEIVVCHKYGLSLQEMKEWSGEMEKKFSLVRLYPLNNVNNDESSRQIL